MRLLEARAAESEPGQTKWGVKWLPTGHLRGSGAKFFAERFGLDVRVMELRRKSSGTQWKSDQSEVKVYLADKSYD